MLPIAYQLTTSIGLAGPVPDIPRGRVIFGGSGDDYYSNSERPSPGWHADLIPPVLLFGLTSRPKRPGSAGSKARSLDGISNDRDRVRTRAGSTNFDAARDGTNCTSYVYAVTDYGARRTSACSTGLRKLGLVVRGDKDRSAPKLAVCPCEQRPVIRRSAGMGYGFNYRSARPSAQRPAPASIPAPASNTFTVQTTRSQSESDRDRARARGALRPESTSWTT